MYRRPCTEQRDIYQTSDQVHDVQIHTDIHRVAAAMQETSELHVLHLLLLRRD